MSRFNTLDQQLKQLHKDEKAEEFENLSISHSQSAQFIKQMLGIFLDYYETIVKPRTNFIPIFQQSNYSLEEFKKTVTRPSMYTYLINLIPPESSWPMKIKPHESTDFAQGGALSSKAWHPNVAAQFKIELHDQFDRTTKTYANILQPQMSIYVWGPMSPTPDTILMSQTQTGTFYTSGKHIHIMSGIDGGWEKSATLVKLTLSDANLPVIEDLLIAALSLVTQNILGFLEPH